MEYQEWKALGYLIIVVDVGKPKSWNIRIVFTGGGDDGGLKNLGRQLIQTVNHTHMHLVI